MKAEEGGGSGWECNFVSVSRDQRVFDDLYVEGKAVSPSNDLALLHPLTPSLPPVSSIGTILED